MKYFHSCNTVGLEVEPKIVQGAKALQKWLIRRVQNKKKSLKKPNVIVPLILVQGDALNLMNCSTVRIVTLVPRKELINPCESMLSISFLHDSKVDFIISFMDALVSLLREHIVLFSNLSLFATCMA